MRNLGRLTVALILLILASPALAQSSPGRTGRETIFALTSGNRLVSFRSSTPGTVSAPVQITGLQPNETLLGIDFRPATLQLYAIGSTNRIYTINTTSGAATQVGTSSFILEGASFGIDFNPSPDRIRLVSNTGQNLRLNPVDGTLSGTDGTLVYAQGDANAGQQPNVTGAAYVNNFAGISATATTLYVIDSRLDILATQGSLNSTPVSPNTGQLFTVGKLGIDVTDNVGFDVSDVSGIAFAALVPNNETAARLYQIDLSTGAAALVGTIGSSAALGGETIRDIAVALTGEVLIGVTGSNKIVSFSAINPTTLLGTLQVKGLSAGDSIAGIDYRPATGQLYALGTSGQVYTVSTLTGTATRIGTPNALTGSRFGVDFNPAPDRIRVVSNTGQNLRLNPVDGTLSGTDTNLAYATGDANFGKNPNIVAASYSNNFAGVAATSTTLYVVDSSLDILATQGSLNSTPVSPNTGQLFTVGALGLDIPDSGTLDISDSSGIAYAAFGVPAAGGSATTLFRINLGTGQATAVGLIGGTVAESISSIAVVVNVETAFAVTSDNRLISFNPRNPAAINSSGNISGLQSGETLVGIDFRPATGVLFGLGSTSRLYTINTTTGVATPVSNVPFSPALNGTEFGFDFNPVPDRIRVTSNTTQDLRLNPNNGAIAGVDGNLAFASSDPNSGKTPSVVASAYINNFPGTTATVLYNLEAGLDILVTQGSVDGTVSPNAGTLFTVGSLGINVGAVASFDVSEKRGIPYAAIQLDGETSSRLYTINLANGAATQIGTTPIGGASPVIVRDLAIANNVALSVVATAPATAVTSGSDLTYTVNITNPVSEPATNVVLSTAVPASSTFKSITAPTGFTCTTPATGATGAINCTATSLAGNSSAVFSIVVVPVVSSSGTTVSLTADVRTDRNDISLVRFNNASSSISATVNLPPGPSITANDIKISSSRIKATLPSGAAVGFVGTTVLVDGVGFTKAAQLSSNNTILVQRGGLTNGKSFKEALPKGQPVTLTFRNSNGGFTNVQVTRR